MSLKFAVRRRLDVTILDLDGRLSLGENSVVLRELVRDLIWDGHKKLVLENSNVPYLDSSGLGELVSAWTATRNRGGELVLAALTKKVHDMLQITRLLSVYPVFADADEALRYFETKRSPQVQLWRRHYADALVLEIAGTLSPEHGCAAVEEAIGASDSDRNVICLCTQILDANSDGCTMLARAAAVLRERGLELVLASVEPRLEEPLRPCEQAGIRRFPTLDQALAAFGIVIEPRDRMR